MMELLERTDTFDIPSRPRRNRRSASIRSLCEETTLRASDLIAPFFLLDGEKKEDPIASLPGISRLSLDLLLKKATQLHRKGVNALALFPVIDGSLKDISASYALDEKGIIPRALIAFKKELPSLTLITDIALDPFTLSGHDGILDAKGVVENDSNLLILQKMALLHAECGADFVAPSATLDGRTMALRTYLDAHGFTDVGILSYTAKYASSLYAPFRTAVHSTLKSGDKKGYQLNPANVREALREAFLEESAGADMLMVKPALYYLDVIAKMKEQTTLPLAAFHVSGEYAMVMAAKQLGYLDEKAVFKEALLSIKRAGADMILSYSTEMIIDSLS